MDAENYTGGQVFPYFGGKRRVASEVWSRFGEVDGYLEPFGGSLAMALANPRAAFLKSETVNDLDAHICNFWRSVAKDPDEVWMWADWPVSQIDLTARHEWLKERRASLIEEMTTDPDACDPKSAGWWYWGICQWIGGGWGAATPRQKRPHSTGQRPHLGDHGMGMHSLGSRGCGDLHALARRLRHTRITCCDWTSLRSTLHNGCAQWGVFLDPPYTRESGRDPGLYTAAGNADHLTLGHEVAAWAREIGNKHKVALCGIEGEYDMPEWDVYKWKTSGIAYRGRNRNEVIWFSPRCRRDMSLF